MFLSSPRKDAAARHPADTDPQMPALPGSLDRLRYRHRYLPFRSHLAALGPDRHLYGFPLLSHYKKHVTVMEKFMLLIREDLKNLKAAQDKERDDCVMEMLAWVEELATTGNYIGGEPLTTEGRYVTKNDVLSDGPFIEAKEGVSGYIMIHAESLEQAAAIAQTCPPLIRGELEIEVRPIMVTDAFHG
jgi:hypothetical protein